MNKVASQNKIHQYKEHNGSAMDSKGYKSTKSPIDLINIGIIDSEETSFMKFNFLQAFHDLLIWKWNQMLKCNW